MQDCKSAATPMAENPNLVTNPETDEPSSVREYQSAIGTLMCAMTQTRPDLAYSVSTLSKFSANPSAKMDAFKRGFVTAEAGGNQRASSPIRIGPVCSSS